MTVDVTKLMKHLAEFRRIFHSEADFQHALAWEVQECPEYEARLEYPVLLFSNAKDAKGAVDIRLNGKRLAIEVKYSTCKWEGFVDSEKYELRFHMTHNARWAFVKDIDRLERIVVSSPQVIGYAILLTNDRHLWSKCESNRDSSRDFSPEGILEGHLRWHSNREKDIQLKGRYDLKWNEYSHAADCPFRYLLVKVAQDNSAEGSRVAEESEV